MIKFGLKVLLFAIIVVLVLGQLDTLFEKSSPFRETMLSYAQHEKDKLSIVFFGNSHTYSSFDPRIFEIELGVNSINLGGPAQRLISTQVLADMVLSETKPDLAVVTIFSLSLDEENNEDFKLSQLKTLDYIPLTLEKAEAIFEVNKTNELLMTFSETLRYHSNWHDISLKQRSFPFRPNSDNYNGFNTTRATYDAKTYSYFEKKYKKDTVQVTTLSTKEQMRIDNLIALFKKNHVPVLFVNAPSDAYELSITHKTYSLAIASYLKSKGQQFLDFNTIKKALGLNKTHYRNPNHLNTNGAISVSHYLARYIKDSLKIQFKNRNIGLSGNRYAYINSNKKGLFQKKMDSVTTKNLFGIKEAILYNIKGNRYELLFPITEDTLGFQKIRLEHDVTENEVNAHGDQKIFFNKDSTKIVFWGTLGNKDVLHFKKKSFAVFPFNTPLKELRNLSFHAGNERRVPVFRIDTLKLE